MPNVSSEHYGDVCRAFSRDVVQVVRHIRSFVLGGEEWHKFRKALNQKGGG